MTKPTFRFAPSPNGYLHLGHAYSALLNFDMARKADGRFLLRIEDIDVTRCRPEYETAIYDDLAWLGLEWETPVRRQSQHMAEYRAAVALLEERRLAYPSFETRAEIAHMVADRESFARWPRDPDGAPLYPGLAKTLPDAERQSRITAGEAYAMRLDTAKAMDWTGPVTWIETGTGPSGETGTIIAAPEVWGDFIIGRKETPTSYHLSVVLDDAAQGITDTLVVFNGDVMTNIDVRAVVALHRERQAKATIVLTPVDNPSAYGLVETERDGRVREVVVDGQTGQARPDNNNQRRRPN